MATAEELLSGSTGEENKILVIDNDLRTIIIPKSIPVLGVESDDEVLRLKFKMPRYVSDTDLSTFSIRINYYNAKDEGDVYTVSDAAIGEGYIYFSWLVGPIATKVKGATKFNVCAIKLDSDGNVDKEFNTDSVTMTVLEGLEANPKAVTLYSDVIEQWRQELFGIGDTEEANMLAVSQEQQNAIANKGTEVLASIPADYTATHSMANEGVRSKADAIICSAQGETIAVSDSSDDYLRGLNLFGKSTQVTMTGKNLLDVDERLSFSGVYSKDVSIPAGTYTITWSDCTWDGANPPCIRFHTNDIWISLSSDNKDRTVVLASDETHVYAYSNGISAVDSNGVNAFIYQVMLTVSGSDDTYEPYTGGVASPSPECPQSIDTIASETVKIYGKNLLDISTSDYYVDGVLEVPYSAHNSIGTALKAVRVYPGRTYTFSYNFVGGDRVVFCALDANYDNLGNAGIKWGTYLDPYYGVYGEAADGATITIPEDSKISYIEIHFCLMGDCGEGNVNTYSNLQFEEGSVATEYEPYRGSQSISVPHTLAGIPVSSGGNYTDSNGQQWICDEVDYERGVYVQRIGTRELSDASKWIKAVDGQQTENTNLFYYHLGGKAHGEFNLLCDRLPVRNVLTTTNDFIGIIGNATTYVVYVRINGQYTLDEFVEWAAENPLTVVYELDTPIETPLTADEIAAFKALHSNYPNTTVLNAAGATMKLKYNADTETWINNLIDSKIAAALAKL